MNLCFIPFKNKRPTDQNSNFSFGVYHSNNSSLHNFSNSSDRLLRGVAQLDKPEPRTDKTPVRSEPLNKLMTASLRCPRRRVNLRELRDNHNNAAQFRQRNSRAELVLKEGKDLLRGAPPLTAKR
jgi:hypothetical protein